MDFASRWLTAEQAQVVQANLADVGITVHLNELEPSTFLNELTGGHVTPMLVSRSRDKSGLTPTRSSRSLRSAMVRLTG